MTIVLTSDFTKSTVARAVPGAFFSKEHKAWVMDNPTPRGAAVALRLFPTVGIEHPELVDLRASLAQDVRPFDNSSAFNTPIGAPRVRALLRELG